MNRTKLIIFDLDGTLLDTIADLARAANYALRCNGYPEHPIEAYRFFVGNGINNLIKRALPEPDRTEENVLRLRRDFVEYYNDHNADLTRPYPGIVPLLEKLQREGIVLAVASNKYQQATQTLVARYFPSVDFCAVFGQREGVPIKPDPQIVYDILSASRADKDWTVYVGDSGVDMKTALSAGIKSIGVLWGFRPKEELEETGACFLADRVERIPNILEEIDRQSGNGILL